MPDLICINGNIACGKSTLLKTLESRGHRVVLEGLNRGRWGNILDKYYKNPKRYGYLFQTCVLADMKRTYSRLKKQGEGHIFVERSPLDCQAFSEVVYECGNMTEDEYSTFNSLYDLLYEAPSVIISLDLDPAVCFERCKARARKCEEEISLDYIEAVDRCTKRVMENPSSSVPVEIHHIDVFGKSTDQIASAVENLLPLFSKEKVASWNHLASQSDSDAAEISEIFQ